jgi:hypothetical protein
MQCGAGGPWSRTLLLLWGLAILLRVAVILLVLLLWCRYSLLLAVPLLLEYFFAMLLLCRLFNPCCTLT